MIDDLSKRIARRISCYTAFFIAIIIRRGKETIEEQRLTD
jgi:hypothetical protein